MPDDLLTTTEALEVLGVDRSTLTRWVAQQKITPVLGGGKGQAFVFRADDVTRLAAERVDIPAPIADAGMAAPQLLARAALLLVVTAIAVAVSWNAPAGTPVAVVLAATAWYVIAHLLWSGALAIGRHQRAGGGR